MMLHPLDAESFQRDLAGILMLVRESSAANTNGDATLFIRADVSDEADPLMAEKLLYQKLSINRGRRLADAPVGAPPAPLSSTAAGIYMVPQVFEGLIVGLALIFFLGIGLSCVFSIQSPDILHSTTLPAGKEY